MPPGEGLFARMIYTVSDEGQLCLDTLFYAPENVLTFTNPDGFSYTPQFVSKCFHLRQGPLAIPDFVGSPVIGEKNLEVSFTDSSEGTIDSWYWSFGDGYFSTSANPVHIYKEAGAYDVKLIVTNQFGSDSLIRENYIQVLAKPLANFTADPVVGAPPLGVQFTDNSIGNVTSWKWYFGDNDSSSLQDPYHEYTSFGAYDVKLISTSDNGSDTVTKEDFIFAYPALSGDSVRILDVTAVPNQVDVVVPIIQSNDYDSLARIKIPLTFGDSSLVQVDSISFVGSRAAHFEQKSIDIDDGNATILIDLFTDQFPYLEVGEGLLAKIYLKVKDVVPPEAVIFESNPSDTMLFVFWDDYGSLEADFCPGTLFVEKAETDPPGQPQNLMALPLELGVSLTWDAVTDPNLRLYAIYRNTTMFTPDSLGDTLATSTGPSYLDSDVSSGQTYVYRVSAVDSSWNESEYSDTASATFGDADPPVITLGPAELGMTDSSVTIYWETDEAANGYVEIWEDPSWVPAGDHSEYLSEHTVTLTELDPSSTYQYRVHSTDSLANGPTYSGTESFTTASAPDLTPPQIILGPAVVFKTHNSATLRWTTDEIANSIVYYGEGFPFADTAVYPDFVTTHSVTLTSLSSENQYFFQAGSEDPSGNGPTYSDTLTFTTEASPDTVPPAIVEGPVHSGITHNKAVISWLTDEIATSIVQYGSSELYGSERGESDFVQSHQIVLTNLQDSTLYHYRAGSVDPESNGPSWSANFWFWTRSVPDTVPPVILTGPYASWVSNTQAQIDWTTDEISDSWVYYGLGGSYDNVTGSPIYVNEHSVVLTNLLPDTTYDYYVSSTDPSSNTVDSRHGGGGLKPLDTADDQFRTKASPDITPPVIISGPHVVYKTFSQAIIKWVTDETGNSIVQYGETQEYGKLITYPEATVNHTVFLANLKPNATYHFKIGSVDISKNGPSYSPDITFTTPADVADTDPPIITVPPTIVYLDESRAIIRWETDEPADSYMGYEPIGSLAEKIVGESFTLLNHMMSLYMEEDYNVRVFSSDQFGNGPTYSDYFTVTAPSSPDVDPPILTSSPEVSYVSENLAKISWETDELSSSFVEYGLTDEYTDVEANPGNDRVHEVTLTNLTPSTTYHYRVKSADVFGNIYLGSDDTFTTQFSSDMSPPAVPTGLSTSYGNQWLKLTWNENQEGDLSGYNLHRGTVYPAELPLIASNLSNTSYKDQGLVNGVTYYYQLTAVDQSSNESPASDVVCSIPLSYRKGDYNGDQEIAIADVVAMINYLFKGAEGHEPLDAGDVNGNGEVTIGDAVYLINYLFKSGTAPYICTIPDVPLARYTERSKAILGLCFPDGDQNQGIEVKLNAEVVEEVAGIQIELSFDPSQVQVQEISTTLRTENLGLYYNIESGKIKIGMVDIYGANTLAPGEGSILKIKFEKKNNQAGISSAKIERAIVVDPSAQELNVQIEPNKVIRPIPQTFSLAQNYPNPFNPTTTIEYALPSDAQVEICIYNILGRKVKVLVDERQLAGYKKVTWDGKNEKGHDVASGVYFCKIKAGDFTQVKKMVLLK